MANESSELSRLFALEKAGRYQEALEGVRRQRNDASQAPPVSKFNLDLLEERLRARLFGIPKERAGSFPKSGAREASPKISIIMPVFNVGPYLDACLLSVRYQTYRNFELIIVDDASTDNSREIIRMHAELDNRIQVIPLARNTPGGGGIPRNIGIRAATGEYIGFVDGDDWLSETAFEKMVAAAERHQADIVIGGFRTFVEHQHIYSEAYDQWEFGRIPGDEIFTARSHPAVFRLSAVPWRKLYRRAFLEENRIAYPEGDYFYEDNPLHWFVLVPHSKLVKIDDIVAYHRMGRDGQTMGSAPASLAAVCSHLNTIGRFLLDRIDLPEDQPIVDEFYNYIHRCCGWIVRRQARDDVKAIIGRRLAQIVTRYQQKIPPADICPNFHERLRKYSEGYPQHDLTIVIPACDCEDFIEETIRSAWSVPGVTTNVLVMDDGSRDGSAEICRRLAGTHQNLHFFQQENRGAGRARNALIPLCTGFYTFFLDADDRIDGEAMARAVREARKGDYDLYFVKYRVEFPEKKQIRGMFNTDQARWEKFRQAKDNGERKRIAASLISYPWNRLIKTELLHDANIFFGASFVHNDIAFHWESLLAANNIGYGEDVVGTHRKFERRAQITNLSDHRRLEAFDALEDTHYRIAGHANGRELIDAWNGFVGSFLEWVRERMPGEMQAQYEVRKARLLDLLAGGVEKACLPPSGPIRFSAKLARLQEGK